MEPHADLLADLGGREERRARTFPKRHGVAAGEDRERAQRLEPLRRFAKPAAAALEAHFHPFLDRAAHPGQSVAAPGQLRDPREVPEDRGAMGPPANSFRPAFQRGEERSSALSDAFLQLAEAIAQPQEAVRPGEAGQPRPLDLGPRADRPRHPVPGPERRRTRAAFFSTTSSAAAEASARAGPPRGPRS